ncbi:MAG: menaquinone via futalosine step 1 [Sulfurospirillaceae bacterium]|nr:menaquinone via futalosine step 1 [Sulfurospirillaceae bacterium]MDD3463188.1 menaquinone via futalosine step 1 [Sulfurospirillaceae bacterium]
MIFGKIDYINLLPFHVFLKKSSLQSSFKQSCERKKSVPSDINRKFKKRAVDGAFISSIESQKKSIKPLSLGIVAKKNVKSVIVKEGISKKDPASATSNILARVLDVKGEVFIGDKALKLYIENPEDYIDLATKWNAKYKLPFVFARLCINNHHSFYSNLTKKFKKKSIKIPQYILKHYSIKRGIEPIEIKKYLSLISYNIGSKENKGLKLFFKKARFFKHIK